MTRAATTAGSAALILVALVTGAGAHTPIGTPTLRQLAGSADAVVHARVIDPHAAVTATDPPMRRPAVEVEVVEVLDGALDPAGTTPRLTFVQHGHGVPSYDTGDDVLLFLRRIERIPELARTPLGGLVRYVSEQESDAKIVLTRDSAATFTHAVQAYAAVRRSRSERERSAGLHRTTVELLTSPDQWLATSALRDLVVMANAPLVEAADVPALAAIVDGRSPARPIGFRIGLLTELERRRLVDGPDAWVRLLRTTTGADRNVVLRAVGAHPSDPVTRELIAMLDAAPTPEAAAAAAVALGTPGNDAAVPALTRALGHDDRRVRGGAIRGLGRIGTPAARQAIAVAAAFQPDTETRRRARAEATLLEGDARLQR